MNNYGISSQPNEVILQNSFLLEINILVLNNDIFWELRAPCN